MVCLAGSFHCAVTIAAPQDAVWKPTPEYLEAQHAVIGEIEVDNANIFDPQIPEENHALYRLANSLHVRTRPKIILRQLLFQSGDPFEQRLLEESERILRSNDYLRDAVITPVRYADGVVDILIHTVDVWTLDPRLSVGRSGGENNSSFGLKDSNLLGTGIHFGLFQKSNVDRDMTQFTLFDRELGNTRYSLGTSYSDNSDGYRAELAFGRPFYALEARRSSGLGLLSADQVDSLYDRGEIQAKFRHQLQYHRIYAGISKGLENGWAHRHSIGFEYQEDRFAPYTDETYPYSEVPEDRKYLIPYYEWQLIEDQYEEAHNHDQIGVTEDRFLGTLLNLRLGYASRSFGSLENALFLDSTVRTGFGTSDSVSLITSADFHSRLQGGEMNDTLMTLGATFHHRQSDDWLLHVALTGNLSHNLDLDHQLLLGGDNGLRGYPLRYQGGDSSLLLTVEERLFTDWYPFHLIRIGAVGFFDAGRTWGVNPVGSENLGWLKDVGVGLRFGNTRSGIGRVVHLDLAFPLDGDSSIDSMQILFKGHASF